MKNKHYQTVIAIIFGIMGCVSQIWSKEIHDCFQNVSILWMIPFLNIGIQIGFIYFLVRVFSNKKNNVLEQKVDALSFQNYFRTHNHNILCSLFIAFPDANGQFTVKKTKEDFFSIELEQMKAFLEEMHDLKPSEKNQILKFIYKDKIMTVSLFNEPTEK